MKTIFVFIFALLLCGCGQSCESIGGQEILTGHNTQLFPQPNGTTVIMQVPVYTCVIKDLNKTTDKQLVYNIVNKQELRPDYENVEGKRWWEDKRNTK